MTKSQAFESTVAGILVLDSNSVGDGRLTRRAIKTIGRARNLGLRVCIPDAVVAELSAHEDQAVGDIIESLRAQGYLLSEDAPANDDEFEVATQEALRKAGVEILPSSEQDLRSALWAQIFRRVPAKPKRASDGKMITTGAVDALVQIHALRESCDSWTCLVTNDSALLKDSRARGLRVESSIPAAIDAARSSALTPERGSEILATIFARESEILSCLGGDAVLVGVASIQSIAEDSRFEATVAWFDKGLVRHGLDAYRLTRIRDTAAGVEVLGERGYGSFRYWDSHILSEIHEFVGEELSLTPDPFRPTVNRQRSDSRTPFWIRLDGSAMELLRGDERILSARVEKFPISQTHYYDDEVQEWTEEYIDFKIRLAGDSEDRTAIQKGVIFSEICRSMGLSPESTAR